MVRETGDRRPDNMIGASLQMSITYNPRHSQPRPLSGALRPSPMRGRGTALAVDEVPTRAPDFVVFPVHCL